MSNSRSDRGDPPAWIVGPEWAGKGLRQPGWLILPLRVFLAVTFCFAGLQKLANPAFFDAHNPSSVIGQMHGLQHSSPIGGLVTLSLHAPVVVGLLIALGELAVGVGALIGLWTRAAAVGGALLSLAFFLTVSWNTSPYYLGADIVFVFGWLTMLAFGTAGVFSFDTWLRYRSRELAGLPSPAALLSIDADRLRVLCPLDANCALRRNGTCPARRDCPVFPTITPLHRADATDLDRRRLLLGARTAAQVGVVAGVAGGLTAGVGRLIGGSDHQANSAAPTLGQSTTRQLTTTGGPGRGGNSTTEPSTSQAGTDLSGQPSSTTAPSTTEQTGTAIARASAVPAGKAGRFRDPAHGEPAWLVHTDAGEFVAFSAICTHAGCLVDYEAGSEQFHCPCHGGRFDATTGRVLRGPPTRPLPEIPVHVRNGEIRVD